MRSFTIWSLATLAILADAQAVSKTARCGPQFGLTCQGSKWGNCCSQYNYCGSTTDYCGTGCQNQWGTCNPVSSPARSFTTLPRSSSVQASSSAAAPTLKVTTNARCGKGFGSTCQGSKYGNCCSQYSYCGSNVDYCGTGCQQGFGTCNAVLSSSVPSSSRSTSILSSSSVRSSSSSSSVVSSSSASSSIASSSSVVSSSSVASSSAFASSSSIASSSAFSSSAPPSSTIPSSTSILPTSTCATGSNPTRTLCSQCTVNGEVGLYITSDSGLTCVEYDLAELICGPVQTTTPC